jgi:phage terminase Nu1 subunit (DNA packaging protein)
VSLVPGTYTITGLGTELGMDRRRIGQLVADLEPVREEGRSKYYRLKDVVNVISAGGLDLSQERAKLAAAQCERVELDVATRKGQLVELSEVKEEWARMVMNCRGRLLALPTSLAPQIAVEGDVNACADMLKAAVYEALTELSQGDVD